MKFLPALLAIAIFPASVFAADLSPFFQNHDRILFQGDSITDGGRWRDSQDLNHIMGQDYGYLIAAKIGAEFPERQLTFLNRGISGNKVTDLAARWQKDALDLKPDVISILIGVNDAGSVVGNSPYGVTAEKFEQVYDQLIKDTLVALPNVRLVLCEPYVLPVGKLKADWDKWNTEVKSRREAVKKLAAKYHLPLAHFQQVLDDACRRAPAEYCSWDGIHPTYAGHQVMADEWLRAVNAPGK
jgi:lysophospholipase L1-like esterase